MKIITIFLFNLFSTSLLAETQTTQSQSAGYTQIIFFVVLIAVFYFLLIRPQQKRAKTQKELINSVKVADEISTASGMIGIIDAVDESFIHLKVNQNTVIQIQKHAISQRLPKGSVKFKVVLNSNKLITK